MITDNWSIYSGGHALITGGLVVGAPVQNTQVILISLY